MLDIDQFKKYNDNYGHLNGDECLKTVVQILSNSIGRSGDFVARYGGEEFVVVLPHTDVDGACLVAERIIKNMKEAHIPHGFSSVADYVSFSIGVTSGTVEPTLTTDDFVRAADIALYEAKKAGGNTYMFGEVQKITTAL